MFISPPGENQTLVLPVLVEGNYGARITAKLYRCSQPETSQKSAVTIEHISKAFPSAHYCVNTSMFISPPGENQTLVLPVLVEGNYGARITAKLYRCSQPETSQKSAVTIEHISKDVISVCARVLSSSPVDVESGIWSMQIGVGTTEGGLQVRPLTSVGHSGHSQFSVHVQHGTLLFASMVAENHAAQSPSDSCTSPLAIHARVTGEGFVYLSVCMSMTEVH